MEEPQLNALAQSTTWPALLNCEVVPGGVVAVVGGLVGMAETDLASWPEHANRRGRLDGYSVIVTRVTDTGESGYDLHVETPGAAALRRRLEERGLPLLDPETAEAPRSPRLPWRGSGRCSRDL